MSFRVATSCSLGKEQGSHSVKKCVLQRGSSCLVHTLQSLTNRFGEQSHSVFLSLLTNSIAVLITAHLVSEYFVGLHIQ